MDDIDAQVHQATLNLLAEVGDYLGRLPAHPMTGAMHKKVQAYLSDPLAVAQRKRVKDLAEAETRAALFRSGAAMRGTFKFTPSGAPSLVCELVYPRLRLESPAYQGASESGEDADAVLLEIAKEIAQGLTVELSPDLGLHGTVAAAKN